MAMTKNTQRGLEEGLVTDEHGAVGWEDLFLGVYIYTFLLLRGLSSFSLFAE